MIVKCNRLYNPDIQSVYNVNSDGYTTIGAMYSVLEIYYDVQEIQYRIFPDAPHYYGHPILVRSDDFEVVSGLVTSNWTLNKYDGSGPVLGPVTWNTYDPWEESFWQDFDNNLPKSRECFDNELKIIFATDLEYVKTIDQQQGRESYFK